MSTTVQVAVPAWVIQPMQKWRAIPGSYKKDNTCTFVECEPYSQDPLKFARFRVYK